MKEKWKQKEIQYFKWKKLSEKTWNKYNINWQKNAIKKKREIKKKEQKVSTFYQKRYKIAMALAGHHRLAKNKLCKYVKRFELPDSRLISLVNSLRLFLAGNVDHGFQSNLTDVSYREKTSKRWHQLLKPSFWANLWQIVRDLLPLRDDLKKNICVALLQTCHPARCCWAI